MAKVTILMPVYNGAVYLRETIESVFNQTFTDFVFLIINDGSTDQTEEIILSYSDPRIIYHKNEINLGLVKTLNKGIELVETEFLARMDADDLWVEDKLEKQIRFLETRTDVGVCGTSIHKFGKFEGDFIFPTNNEVLKVGFLFYCCMSHPSVIYRMSFLKQTGLRYRSDYFPAEDYKMWIDCLEQTQIYNIPEKLVLYRQHNEQITQDSNAKQTVMTNVVRLEVLSRIYNGFTEDEKKFHVEQFLTKDISSNADYLIYKKWSETIQIRNREQKYMDAELLRDILYKHVQLKYGTYLRKKYFEQYTISSVVRYVFSFNWTKLSIKNNLKIIFKH